MWRKRNDPDVPEVRKKWAQPVLSSPPPTHPLSRIYFANQRMLGRDVCRVNALSAPDLLSRAVGWCFEITAEAADHRSCLQGFTDKVQCWYLQTEQNMDWGHHLSKKVTDFTTSVDFAPVVFRVWGLPRFVRRLGPFVSSGELSLS